MEDGGEHAGDVVARHLAAERLLGQANPARARNREAVMLPSDSQVPTLGLPARRSRLTGFGRMADSFNDE